METLEKIQSVIDDYNAIAQDYANEVYGNDKRAWYIQLFLRSLKGKKVLDAGCGNGNDCRYVYNQGYEVIGIDFSEKMLDIAKEKLPNIEFHLMDMSKTTFQNNSFDGLITNCSLIHVPKENMDATLQEFGRVLKKGGKMFLVVFNGEGEQMIDEPFEQYDIKVYMNYTNEKHIVQKWFQGIGNLQPPRR